MRVRLVVVGKIKEADLRAVSQDYEKRIGRYATFDLIELKDEQVTADLLIAKGLKKGKRIALEVEGKHLSSHELARVVGQTEGSGIPELSFFIGGSYGLPQDFSAQADIQLSLSRMTLPHRLARVMLLEQVYRAFTILRNEPYSH